jgi:AcrR family transcriptional regulator
MTVWSTKKTIKYANVVNQIDIVIGRNKMSEEMSKRDEQKFKTKNKILETAMKIILNPNFSTFTTNELAEKAGVSKGLIFHYFESKEKLILKVFEKMYELNVDQVLLEPDSELDPAVRLIEYTKMNFEMVKNHVNINSLLLQFITKIQSKDHLIALDSFIEDFGNKILDRLSRLFVLLGWPSEEANNAVRIYLAVLDGISIQLELSRHLPSQDFLNFDGDSIFDLIVKIFDKRQ